ncbi:MAG: ABC transporter permease subunit [Anaerolineales bacterium]|nr:ABC transporter permease subunit [Anaerolineales bacterium]
MDTTEQVNKRKPRLIPIDMEAIDFPWWALLIIIFMLIGAFLIAFLPRYQDAFLFLFAGVGMTIGITIASFSMALILGLIAGLGRVSKNVVFRTFASFYVEIVRGIPLLVLIIYFAFVATEILVNIVNWIGVGMTSFLAIGPLLNIGEALSDLHIQDVPMWLRAVFGLAFGYGAYEAEVFRAGIESISKGQMEAARSLGMTYGQAMRHIILPQAIRRVLPPFGNDFISMLKDSSLVSVLAVRELTHLGKLNRARTFRTFETWNTVAFLYLILTLSLSFVVKIIERRMAYEE